MAEKAKTSANPAAAPATAPVRVTLAEIESGAGYAIRPGATQYEAYPGGWLTLAGRDGRITIAMGRAVEAITEQVVAERIAQAGGAVPASGVSLYDVMIEKAKACATWSDGFDWAHEDLDGAILERAVADFFLRSSGMLKRPGSSSIS